MKKIPSTIEEGNEVLAKYMGAFIANRSKKKPLYSFRDNVEFCSTISLSTEGEYLIYRDELMFHESWDWLMAVIEKISQTYDFTIQYYDGECNCYCQKQNYGANLMSDIGYGGFTPKIQSVFWTAVALVEKHNKNNQF